MQEQAREALLTRVQEARRIQARARRPGRERDDERTQDIRFWDNGTGAGSGGGRVHSPQGNLPDRRRTGTKIVGAFHRPVREALPEII